MNSVSKKEKYIGTLLAGCCGDVLGSQTEGMFQDDILKKFGKVRLMPSKKLYTDDTEMTIVLARHLTKNKTIDQVQLHREYGNEIGNKGYSSNTRNILTKFKINWEQSKFLSLGISGCDGAVMRISPLGLIKMNFETTVWETQKAIYYTHGANSDAHSSTVLHCRVINALVNNKFKDRHSLFLYVMKIARKHPDLWVKINIVKFCLNSGEKINITEELLGNKNIFQIKAIDALCCAYYIFFKFYNQPKEAICYAAGLGGDTDTIAKIVGDLCGALHGYKWIPKEWRGVEGEDELIKLGICLYNLYN